jgi:ABC-type glycerol-3-phosphate transport system permease component
MTARIEDLSESSLRPGRSSGRPAASVREARWGLIFISPWIVGLVLLTAIPIVASLLLSFTNYNILFPEQIRWVGLDNYAWAASDPATSSSALLTLKFAAVSIPFGISAALGIALVVNHRLLVGKRAFRTLFFMPVQIPVVASVFIWLGFISSAHRVPVAWLQSTSTNIADTLSSLPVFSYLATVYPTGWFTDRSWTLPWLILMSVWGIGNMTLIFLAGLQAVPSVLYEAATVDGAGAWRSFRHVTLPMISPMVFYNLILSIIGVAGYFTQAYLWSTNSRSGDQANVWNLNLYNTGWDFNAMGRACALAWLLFVVVITLSVVLFWTARHWVYYAGADAATTKPKANGDEPAAATLTETPALLALELAVSKRRAEPDATESDAPARELAAEPDAPEPDPPARELAAEPDPPALEPAAAPAAAMATPPRKPSRRRSKLRRFFGRLTSRTAFTIVAAVLCVAFLLPLLYALSAAFSPPGGGFGRGAPDYPAAARTYTCTDSQVCTYRPIIRDRATGKWVTNGTPIDVSQSDDPVLPVYAMPGYGNLALLEDLSPYGQPSVFIDPAANKQVDILIDDPGRLSRVWDFQASLDNFATAVDWAGLITATGPGGMASWLLNSVIIAVFSTIGAVLSAVLVAYGFARFRFPGRDVLFLILIGSVLIPYPVTLIPQFILYRILGLTGGFLPLILPNFFGNAVYIFLLRQFFMALPRDLDEAAMVDGAGPLRILRSVIAPQALPAIIAVALFQFFFSWGDFLGPLVYLSGNAALYPLSLGVNYFTFALQQGGTNGPGILVAGSLLVMIVPVVIFFIAQRYFVRGVVISGVEK